MLEYIPCITFLVRTKSFINFVVQGNFFQLDTARNIKKRTLNVARYLVAGLAVTLLSAFYLYPQVFYCETVRLSDFNKIQNNVYASPDIKPGSFKLISKIVGSSVSRVDSFYNSVRSRPLVIICSDKSQYQKYCNSTDGAGCSLGTPWGSSFVVVSDQGLNVDVISHEMSHVELLAQLGWWKTLSQIPQWFNEGLALMLDKRFVSDPNPLKRYLRYRNEWLYYSAKEGQKLELKSIQSFKGFFAGDERHVMLAYMTSGMEVSYWLALSGDKGFHDFLAIMRNGTPFEEAYGEVSNGAANPEKRKLPGNPFHRKNSQENPH